MDAWLEEYRAEGERILLEGHVKEIDFSGPTYQIEVSSPNSQESWWPFLQFDEQSHLKDAFCSCSSEHQGCPHLAAAYLAIFGEEPQPLHLRFESSLWNHLAQLLAEHSGYEPRFLEKKGEGHYFFQNDITFDLKITTSKALSPLKELIEVRPKETPENSLKFSTLSQEEIGRWREGRPSPSLRYVLSLWFDLAKWMMRESKEAILQFKEDSEGFPTLLNVTFPSFTLSLVLRKKDLVQLIPYLNSVTSPLKLFLSKKEEMKTLYFDPQERAFHITYTHNTATLSSQESLALDGWGYVKGMGFYPEEDSSLLGRSLIGPEEAPSLMEQFPDLIARYIPFHDQHLSLSYSMHFDAQWHWHFSAYLFEEGDLLLPDRALIGNWVYLGKRGFFSISPPLFDHISISIPSAEVSHFVNHHRIWLNTQEGFQTHLATIESHLNYEVTEKPSLRFYSKSHAASTEMMDFGDWIYYREQGFFSKQHIRPGLVARAGLEIAAHDIESFIRANREELETIPHFFASRCPVIARGLSLTMHSSSSIELTPIFTPSPDYAHAHILFFGDLAYIPGEGFYSLPLSMHLPPAYKNRVILSHGSLSYFLESELPHLQKLCIHIDPELRFPHKLELVTHYLARTQGGLRAQFFYHTECGKVALTDLLESIEKKRRYCFTKAGLIDLHREEFRWMRQFKHPFNLDAQTIEISSLELMRLDATFGLNMPLTEDPTSQITRQVLKELRELSSHEPPNLKGLTSTLRTYQQTGIQWLWFLYKNGLSGLLCDDMGLGKTHQAMALIAATLNEHPENPKRYLVVCPTSVIYHWQDKLEMFLPHIKVHVFHGLKRSLDNLPAAGCLLTSYGILRSEKKRLGEIPFEVVILDEIQLAKNPHSRLHDALKSIRAKMRVGLTGTPIENNLRELKSLFDVILPGYMPSEARYRELFINPIEKYLDPEKKLLLSRMIRPFVLRRRKVEVLQELPEKSEDKSYCDLSNEQVILYKNLLTQTRKTVLADLQNQSLPVNYVHIFSLFSQLKQVCNHPALIYKDPMHYSNYSSGKWNLFVELLEEIRESDQKVVIFSQYLYMLDIMEHYLKSKGWGYAQIRGDTVNRREEMKRFQEDPSCVVFIGSLQAAGLGIDLTAASVVIMYDRWWNAARENQAIDRVHRMGQKRGVQVYKLITKNTIEEKIDRMITHKGQLLEEIIAADDQDIFKKFTREELLNLLTFSEEPEIKL